MSGFDIKAFGAAVRRRRRELDLTQEEFEDLAGLGQGMATKYESGDTMPGADKVWAIAEALDTTPTALMAQGAA